MNSQTRENSYPAQIAKSTYTVNDDENSLNGSITKIVYLTKRAQPVQTSKNS